MLTIDDLSVAYGDQIAIRNISLQIRPGEVVGLIGPNGAGKTTLFNCLSRLYTADNGDILFGDRSILDATPHAIAEFGIGRTFQNLALFGTMTVLQNVI